MTIHIESTFFTNTEFATVADFTEFLYATVSKPQTAKDALEKGTLTEAWTQLSPTSFKIVRDWSDITELNLYKTESREKLAILSQHGIIMQPDLYVEIIS